jgi:nitrite reductase/ring-hydroxylating ferredoxin subunit
MIPDHWYPVFESKRRRGRPVALRRMGLDLVLWRDGHGRTICMLDRCPHRGVALSRGRVRDGQLECGYHGFRFDSAGDCQLMPCEGRDARIPKGMCVPGFATREAYGLVWLFWTDHAVKDSELPPIPWLDEFGEARPGDVEGRIDWPLHYVRSIESNFDVHHTPFLHAWLAPGVGTRVDPYEVEVEGSTIRTRGELRREGKSSGVPFRVEFVAPSVTLLEVTGVQFLVADCPVDDDNTWRFARYRSVSLRIPGLRWLWAWLFLQSDFRIAQQRQDLPMVRTQRPRHPDQDLDRLVRADAGTAAYLKLRRSLLARSASSRAATSSTRPPSPRHSEDHLDTDAPRIRGEFDRLEKEVIL